MKSLRFLFASNHHPISLNPSQSDLLVNQAHMLHLMGTLVTEHHSGQYGPHIARSWSIENDSRTFKFSFWPDLQCEDGEKITPLAFKQSFERSLRLYARDSVPVFQHLLGFSEFKRGGDLAGLRAVESELTFEFDRPIKTGLFEFLAMPYYGYYASKNFGKNGIWLDDLKIISSGPYKLFRFDSESRRIELESRSQWWTVTPQSPLKVMIEQKSVAESLVDNAQSTIVFHYNDQPVVKPQCFRQLTSRPETLVAMVVSPEIENIFRSNANRQILFSKLRIAQQKISYPGEDLDLTDFIYAEHSKPMTPNEVPLNFAGTMNRPLRVVLANHLDAPRTAYIKALLDLIFAKTKLTYVIEALPSDDPRWFEKFTANTYYDLRVAGVSVGHEFQSWVVKMMFGSRLGVSFPDVNGRVTQLMESFETSAMTVAECVSRMNQIVHEDQTVIPILHRRYSWFVSEDVEYEAGAITAIPRFEAIRFKP